MDKLLTIAATLAIITVSTGRLSKVLHEVRLAQMKLIKDSQASKWGTPALLHVK